MDVNEQTSVDQSWTGFEGFAVQSDSTAVPHAPAVRHPLVTIVLHWTTALAIVISVAAIYYRDYTEDRGLRILLLDVHRQLGLLVLIGVMFRLMVRYLVGLAKPTTGVHAAMHWIAAITHQALYALLIALPVLGLAATSAKGITLQLFGLAPLPSLTAPDPDVADNLLDYHMWAAWVLFGLVGAHAAGALWHHFVRRDGVLRAMLPVGGSRLTRPLAPGTSPVGNERRRSSLPVSLERRRSLGTGA